MSTEKKTHKQATPVHGSTGEAQMNMDVNLRRLPDKKNTIRNS